MREKFLIINKIKNNFMKNIWKISTILNISINDEKYLKLKENLIEKNMRNIFVLKKNYKF